MRRSYLFRLAHAYFLLGLLEPCIAQQMIAATTSISRRQVLASRVRSERGDPALLLLLCWVLCLDVYELKFILDFRFLRLHHFVLLRRKSRTGYRLQRRRAPRAGKWQFCSILRVRSSCWRCIGRYLSTRLPLLSTKKRRGRCIVVGGMSCTGMVVLQLGHEGDCPRKVAAFDFFTNEKNYYAS